MPLLPPRINIALFSPTMDFTQNLGLTHIGMYGRKHERYLKEYHPAIYEILVLTEKLPRYLFEVDTAYNEEMEYLIKEIARREGVTEALKRADPMTWVGYMNNIHHRAEEIVLHDLVYAY